MKRKNVKGFFLSLLLFVFLAVPGMNATAADDSTLKTVTINNDKLYQSGYLESGTESTLSIERYGESTNVTNAKKAIAASITNIKSSVNISEYNIPFSDIEEIFNDVINSHPEFFYVESASCTYYSEDCINSLKWNYTHSKSKIKTMKTKLKKKMKEAVSWTNTSMTTAEKILAIHDYIALNTTYTTSSAFTGACYTSYGVLVNHKGVCQGYALAFNLIMDELGIDSEYVSSEEMNHAWNYVKVSKKWYHVDVTWDDPVGWDMGFITHQNFLLSDSAIKKTGHYSFTPSKSTGTKYDSSTIRSIVGGLYYYNKYWYYMSAYTFDYNNDQLSYNSNIAMYKMKFSGSSKKTVLSDSSLYSNSFLVKYADALYYNTNRTIYQYNPKTGKKLSIKTTSSNIQGIEILNAKLYYTLSSGKQSMSIKKIVPITGVKLSKKKLTLDVEGKYTLTATVSPYNATVSKAVTWKSSNKSVATVDQYGKIKAKKAGKTTITVKTSSGKKATCKVTVKVKKPTKVTIKTIKSADYHSVKLTWQKAGRADGYVIYRAAGKNGTYKAIKTIKKSATLSYKDTGLTTGKTYYYKVRAYRTVNSKKVYGKYSAVKKGKAKPSKPKLSSITSVSSSKVKVRWKKVSKADGYVVYRSTSKKGTYKAVKTVKSNSKLQIADKGLKKGTTYYYKVRAYKVVNGKKVYSSYSKYMVIKK